MTKKVAIPMTKKKNLKDDKVVSIDKKPNVDDAAIEKATAMLQELISIFNETNHHPSEGLVNISFIVFMLANYEEGYILENYPVLYKEWGLGEDED